MENYDGLRDKCFENIDSAEFLEQEEQWMASVHAAYYSCIQLLLYIFYERVGSNENALKQEYFGWKESNRRDSGIHVFYIRKAESLLKKSNYRYGAQLRSNLFQLKEIRHRSDYSPEIMTDRITSEGLTLANKTVNLLKDHYHVKR